MARRSSFHSRSPLAHDAALSLEHTTGAFSFLNPTRAHFSHVGAGSQSAATASSGATSPPPTASSAASSTAARIGFRWRSRDNRKGRHALAVDPALPTLTPSASSASSALVAPARTNTPRAVASGVLRIFTSFPYWDVSWLVAMVFSVGSMIWVVNAFFVWLPLQDPATEFAGEGTTAGGWSAFVGATVFEIGSVLLMLEAVNENRAGCFGWAVERAVHDAEAGAWHVRPRGRGGCDHHHANRKNFVGAGAGRGAPAPGSDPKADTSGGEASSASSGAGKDAEGSAPRGTADKDGEWDSSAPQTWQWFPSWRELREHYLYELGFLACSFQMLGATVFWISGFTAIPEIFALLPDQVSLNFGYWIPQIVGGCGFIASSLLFMLETQRRWYLPAFGTLGWHIGLWNLIGAFGFTLCGALGPAYGNQEAQYQASLATFWGSWAFLVGSLIQLYESLDKHPVEAMQVEQEKKSS